MRSKRLATVTCPRTAPIDRPAMGSRGGTRLAMAWALFALAGATASHAAGTGGGQSSGGAATGATIVADADADADRGTARAVGVRPIGVSGTRLADAGNLGAYRIGPGGKVPYAIGADPLPDTVDSDTHVDGTSQSGRTAFTMTAVPIRSVPEPSELALLGDGLLVLIAWIAGRQARRSRSMAAMTERDQH